MSVAYLILGILIGLSTGFSIGSVVTKKQVKQTFHDGDCKFCKHKEECLGDLKKLNNDHECVYYVYDEEKNK